MKYAKAPNGIAPKRRTGCILICKVVENIRLVEVKLGGDALTEKGATSLFAVADKIDVTRMKKPSFMMVLVADGDFAYRRKDGGIVCPIWCLRP